MNTPRTVCLVVKVGNADCRFDGRRWFTPNLALSELLNETTRCAPKTFFTVRSLVEHVLARAGVDQIATIDTPGA